MTLLQESLQLSKLGFACHWLNPKQKRPIGGKWSSRGYQQPELLEKEYADGNNIGFMPGQNSIVSIDGRQHYIQVIDVDFNVVTPETKSAVLREVITLLGPDWKETYPIVKSGSGGPSMHVYFLSPTPLKSKLLVRSSNKVQVVKGGRTRHAYEWEIELYGTGKNIVLPPSIHPDTGNPYMWARAFEPSKLESYVIEDFGSRFLSGAGDKESDLGELGEQQYLSHTASVGGHDEDEALQLFGGLSTSQVLTPLPIIEQCLTYIKNDDNHYDEWLRMGMALHAATEGSEEGFEFWDKWSQDSSKYDGKEMRYKWKSFKNGLADGISGATLKWWAKENGWSGDASLVKDLLSRVETWDDGIRLVANSVSDPARREVLMKVLAKRAEELIGDKVSVTSIKASIKQIQAEDKKGDIACNALFDPWVYVREQVAFCNMDDGREYDKEQFNDYMDELLYGSMAEVFDESTPPASKLFIRNEGARKTEGKVYVPGGDTFEYFEGRECINVWRNTLVRGDLDTDPTKGEKFAEHIRKLIPNRTDAENLLDYLAMLVQYPGKKCMWWPLLVGGEGNGKSVVSFMMREIIGGRNVAMPTNENLREKFMDWAASAQLVMIEELWSTERLDTVEKLKPLANKVITIRPFNGKAYRIPNHMNLIANSNHEDNALPLANGNRRWYVIQTDNDLCPKDDRGHEKPHVVKYHREFWTWLTGGKEDINKGILESIAEMLSQRDITRFMSEIVDAPAPMTQAGTNMSRNTASAEAQILMDAIEDGVAPFNTGIVTSKDVREYIEANINSRMKMANSRLSKVLRDSGFIKIDSGVNRGRFIHGGERHVLYMVPDSDFVFGDLTDTDYVTQLATNYFEARGDGLGDFSDTDLRTEMLKQYGRLKEA